MDKIKFVDQLGRSVWVPAHPKRIISLVPSITELLFDLGLEEQIIGITKFCVHPKDKVRFKRKIGGTKTLKLNLINELNPDLIIGNKEENVFEQIQALESNFSVWMSDCNSFEEGIDLIQYIGQVCGVQEVSFKLTSRILSSFSNIELGKEKTFLYFIWNQPNYLAGQQTFINSMLEKIGFKNKCYSSRYPEWIGEQPEIVFLSSEPFPFKEEHKKQFALMFPNSRIHLIDGEMCSWYGSRMLKSADYFKSFLLNEGLG